jgi:hypothetical protein
MAFMVVLMIPLLPPVAARRLRCIKGAPWDAAPSPLFAFQAAVPALYRIPMAAGLAKTYSDTIASRASGQY